MSSIRTKNEFLAQFSTTEFRNLCKHRGFLFLLNINIVQAACLAANILNRCIAYPLSHRLEAELPQKKTLKKRPAKKSSQLTACLAYRQEIRFAHRFKSC
jgi:hypothetical protein